MRKPTLTAVAGVLLFVVATVGSTPSAFAAESDTSVSTAAVEVDGHVLFELRGTSALPAPVRAAAVRDRIEGLAADPTVRPDALQVVPSGEYIKLMVGERSIVTLVDADAQVAQVSLTVLADVCRKRIAEAIDEYREARRPENLLRGALMALAATAVLALSVGFLIWFMRRLDVRLERRFERRIKELEIQSFELLRAEQLRGALHNLLRAIRTLSLLGAALVYVHFVLALFPWTHGYAGRLLHVVVGPLSTMGRAILASVPNLVFLVILFVVIRFVLRITTLFFDAVKRGSITLTGFDPEWAMPTYRIARVALIAFGVVIAYPYIPGSESAAFKGVSLFLGVIFSLGSSSVISNVIAGYTMTYRRAFKVGDRIQVGETIGDVVEVRLQVTHLRSLKNEEIVIPNSLILSSQIINYSSLATKQGLILHTTVGIGYETPWRQVEAMLLMAADRTIGLLKDPAPFVLQRKLGDFCIDYEINAHCGQPQAMMAVYTDLHRNILDVFNEYGVQIMTPAYVHDPEQPKMVPAEQWYMPPARHEVQPQRPGATDGSPAATTAPGARSTSR
ncbi:MAG TPA: mechanosensitive ion channel domain-containing protein [Candidatus Acidoferrales bacterium]|nr:mechanosensitive ion channel domain-containing protein [Candidatus Acidoferrales bacterium]